MQGYFLFWELFGNGKLLFVFPNTTHEPDTSLPFFLIHSQACTNAFSLFGFDGMYDDIAEVPAR